MSEKYINIIQEVTHRCTLACAHCFGEFGPRREKSDLSTLKALVDHYPRQEPYHLEVTGGEPFEDRQLLYGFLEHVRRCNPPSLLSTHVHSNGTWITDEASVRQVVDELLQLGVERICFMGNDKWHRAAGLDTDKVAFAAKVAREHAGSPDFVYVVPEIHTAVPIGRGRSGVSRADWDLETTCYIPLFDVETRIEFTVSPNGTVYLCQNNLLPLRADLLHSTFEEVVERFGRHPLVTAIRVEGIAGLARAMGMTEEETAAELAKVGDCILCDRLIGQFPERIREACG